MCIYLVLHALGFKVRAINLFFGTIILIPVGLPEIFYITLEIEHFVMNKLLIIPVFFAFCFIFSCTPEKDESIDRLVVRLKVDPERINPLLRSSNTSREVYQYITLMPAELNPTTLEWEPLLLKELPEAVAITEGDYVGQWAYDFEFLSDAVWSDGRPVSSEDYLFTYKVMFHKGINLPGLKSHYSKLIKAIEIKNEKQYRVVVEKPDRNTLIAICGVEVYPRHYYDPDGTLKKYSLDDLRDDDKYDDLVAVDPKLAEFGTQFHDAKYSREVVQGAGPYELVAWETDQFLRLKKKENYWGRNYPDRIPLNAYPQEIIFQIVKDDIIAISQLKGRDLDMAVLEATTGEKYEELRKDEILRANFDFYTPQLLKYFNIQLNNENPILADKKVRRALAHLIDVDRLIDVIEGGNGKRAVSIISSTKPYYNSELSPITFDPEKAKTLLANAGWIDTNDNGVLDKEIDGIREELILRFFTTNTALGQRLALAYKEGAAQAGVSIELITQTFRTTLSQNLKSGDYEMVAMSSTMSPIDQPILQWHSSAIGGNGQNRSRFSNARADKVMDELESTTDANRKAELFKEIQKIIYDEQPIIMLYFPVEKILVNKKYDPLITSRRPGYLANAFKLAKN